MHLFCVGCLLVKFYFVDLSHQKKVINNNLNFNNMKNSTSILSAKSFNALHKSNKQFATSLGGVRSILLTKLENAASNAANEQIAAEIEIFIKVLKLSKVSANYAILSAAIKPHKTSGKYNDYRLGQVVNRYAADWLPIFTENEKLAKALK